jgi:hypothetical protein
MPLAMWAIVPSPEHDPRPPLSTGFFAGCPCAVFSRSFYSLRAQYFAKIFETSPGGQTTNLPSRLRVLRVRLSDRQRLKTHAKSRRTRSSVSGCCYLTFVPSVPDIWPLDPSHYTSPLRPHHAMLGARISEVMVPCSSPEPDERACSHPTVPPRPLTTPTAHDRRRARVPVSHEDLSPVSSLTAARFPARRAGDAGRGKKR